MESGRSWPKKREALERFVECFSRDQAVKEEIVDRPTGESEETKTIHSEEEEGLNPGETEGGEHGNAPLYPTLALATAIGSLTVLEEKTEGDDLPTNCGPGCQQERGIVADLEIARKEEASENPYEEIFEGCRSAVRDGNMELEITQGRFGQLIGPMVSQAPVLAQAMEIKRDIKDLKKSLKRDNRSRGITQALPNMSER
jgi:hypothetical protein